MPSSHEMYEALVRRDSQYEGIFVVAVRTTGIFCRPTCAARTPKASNVEFYPAPREALLAGYRPCKRCTPMEPAGAAPVWLDELLAAIENEPTRRFKDADLCAMGLEPARVRRWFKRHHGMTFQAYQRARRLGAALGQLRQGADLTATAYDHGYESLSGFRDAFRDLFGDAPGRARGKTRVVVSRVLTPLGAMLAGATDTHLCLLEFCDRRMLETQIARLRKYISAGFVPGENEILAATQAELDGYFQGTLEEFSLPLLTPGTEFQRAVWDQLVTIPYGQTRTYAEQAQAIGRPQAVRAVGKANGDNRLAIVIPCHRVIGARGELVGYGGQLWRKKALLELESRHTHAVRGQS